MSVFKCKMCGGTIEFEPGATVGVCDSCGTKQTLPKLDDDRRANLYDRANHFRRNNEFDKAIGIYEQILNEDGTDAEAYWSLVLCRYGIEYVEDPATHKRVPTVNRAQFTSIFDDDNYKSALQYADGYQRSIYEEEAATINEIQKGILAISQKEEPFDVFICYKETDANGRRTQDSVLANDLYHQLTQEGFKVFFSRITLEDKLGTAYEPYIFAALNSAKVMVVLGTKPEYFNAVWVKNEWSRYLALIKNGAKKVLIPAYRDMDPYDLPEEFSHLQAQDMSKLGFMQDLIRGIKKLAETDAPKAGVRENVAASGGGEIAPLLKRAFMFLEDENWSAADEYCEKVLDMDPEIAEAYLGKLMAELYCSKANDLKDLAEPFDGLDNYKKALRFADADLQQQLRGCISYINDRNETTRKESIYQEATGLLTRDDYSESNCLYALEKFRSIIDYKDAAERVEECLKKAELIREKAEIARKDAIYASAKLNQQKDTIVSLKNAQKAYSSIAGWKDADECIAACQRRIEEIKAEEERQRLEKVRKAEEARIAAKKKAIIAAFAIVFCAAIILLVIQVGIPGSQYKKAEDLLAAGDYDGAIAVFTELGDFRNAGERVLDSQYKKAEALLAAGKKSAAAVVFGKAGDYSDAQKRVSALWSDIMMTKKESVIGAGKHHTVGLKSDGTVVVEGNNDSGQCNVSEWNDIVTIAAGEYHTVGLKSDGTVVAAGRDNYSQCNVSEWSDIVSITAGYVHTVGLKADGTVVAVGNNDSGQCNVSEWSDIVAIAAGEYHTVGLKSDGTVVAAGRDNYSQCNVSEWSDIVSIAAGYVHTVGLKLDGTVVTVGSDDRGQSNASKWNDIVAVAAGGSYTVGLKLDGTVVAAGSGAYGQRNVSEWNDIVAVAAGGSHAVGLKADGTAVAVGANDFGQCNISHWAGIQMPNN